MEFLNVLLFCIAFDFDEVPLLELRLVAIVSCASNVAKRPSKNQYVFSKIKKKKIRIKVLKILKARYYTITELNTYIRTLYKHFIKDVTPFSTFLVYFSINEYIKNSISIHMQGETL